MLRHPAFLLYLASKILLARPFLFWQEISRVCSKESDQNKMKIIKWPDQIFLK